MAIKITDPKIRVTMINDKVRMYLLPPLFNAAVRAGASIMRVYKNLDDYDISLKDDKTPITLADRVAHKTIREYLGPTRIPILSEEGREMRYEERRNWELYWLVDPLDGTVEFIKGNNEFTVNIALMENNVCMGAVIYVPYFEKMYIAGRDSGSYLKEHIAPDAAAFDGADQIDLAQQVGSSQRLTDNHLQGIETEVVVDVTAVDGDSAGAALIQANAGDGRLATAGAVLILSFALVHSLLPPD